MSEVLQWYGWSFVFLTAVIFIWAKWRDMRDTKRQPKSETADDLERQAEDEADLALLEARRGGPSVSWEQVKSAKDAIRYGKALRFVRMAAQTLDERVPDEYGDQTEGAHYNYAVEALDAAAQQLAILKSRSEP